MERQDRQTWMLLAAGLGALAGVAVLARRMREYSLQGKTVLITGGSRGLGLVMARRFAREGARLVICARDERELAEAREDLIGRGAEVLTVPCDITNRAQVDALVQAARQRFSGIDVLVNNAGIIQTGPMETMTLEDYEQAMRVHFWGPLYLTLAVLPEMQRRQSGRIVNISSIGGKISLPHLLPYSASKFALTGFSEGLRAELAKDGIVVTTVCPGLMRTGSPRNAQFKGQHQAEYTWFYISGSLPGLTSAAEVAARQIVSACKRGDAELVIGVPAKAAVLFHGVLPGLTTDLLGVVNQMLPGPDGAGTESHTGAESETPLTRSWITGLSQKAAQANNEVR